LETNRRKKKSVTNIIYHNTIFLQNCVRKERERERRIKRAARRGGERLIGARTESEINIYTKAVYREKRFEREREIF